MANKKSKYFEQFEQEFFSPREIKPDESLFGPIYARNPDKLTPEEKQIAEEMLLNALKQKFDKRWIYGLEQLKSEKGLELFKELFNVEKDISKKILLAESILHLDAESSEELKFIFDTIKSSGEDSLRAVCLVIIEALLSKGILKRGGQLVLDTLFETMADKAYRVRECSYEALIEYFKISEFIPKKDPISELLKQENEKEHKKAVQLFKDIIENIEICECSSEKIEELVNNLFSNISLPRIHCEICKCLADEEHADWNQKDSLPKEIEQLEDVLIFAYYQDRWKRCPICGRIYIYKYYYEYYIGGGEEEEWLIRATPEVALDMAKTFSSSHKKFNKIIKVGNIYKIDRI